MNKLKHLCLLGILSVLGLSIVTNASFAQTSSKTKEASKTKKGDKSGQFGRIGTRSRTEIPENLKKDAEKIQWRLHKSITGVFETKFPQKYKYKIFPFQFNENTFASSAEIISALDGNVESTREKSLLIKVTQTFGSELTYKEMKAVLERSARRYVLSAKSIGGAVLTNKDIQYKGFFGKDIYISYKIKDEKYGLRIRLYMTNFSKVEQVLSGPSHTMYSYRSDDFFDTIVLYDGITTKPDIPMGYGWIDHTSKHNVFTVKLPPQNKDYTPFPPKFTTEKQSESMRLIIVDPVTEVRVKYNVYSYKSDRKYSYSSVKALIFSKHVTQFVRNVSSDSLNMKSMTIDGMDAMRTKLVITPTDKHPGITTIVIEAQYKDNILVIQEFLSGKKHTQSNMDKTFFSLLKFHPEKYKAPLSPSQKTSNKATTLEDTSSSKNAADMDVEEKEVVEPVSTP